MNGMRVDPPKELPAFEFVTADGKAFSTAPVKGQPVLVFFGYTNCPDSVCPTTLADWARAKRQLGEKGKRIRFVFVSVDRDQDTPASVQRYASKFDPGFVGVVGDSATTVNMQQAFGVASFKEPDHTGGYHVAHSAHTFLLDDRGRLIAIYSFGMGWDALYHDLDGVL